LSKNKRLAHETLGLSKKNTIKPPKKQPTGDKKDQTKDQKGWKALESPVANDMKTLGKAICTGEALPTGGGNSWQQ